MGGVETLILNDDEGMLKNVQELAEEIRNGGVHCMMLAYMRKDEDNSARVFKYGGNTWRFLALLALAKHDLLVFSTEDADVFMEDAE